MKLLDVYIKQNNDIPYINERERICSSLSNFYLQEGPLFSDLSRTLTSQEVSKWLGSVGCNPNIPHL